MAEAFLSAIGGAVRFNRKRFARDFENFKPKQSEKRAAVSVESLDFFHNHKPAGPNPKKPRLEEEASSSAPFRLLPSTVALNADDDDKDAAEDEERNARVAKQEVRALRKEQKIHVQGTDIADPAATFDDFARRLGVPEYLIRNLRAPVPNGCGYALPTPVQMQAVPVMVSGRDVLAYAPTGSGKTAAYLLPLFTLLKAPGKSGLRAVILAPTKELADQIHRHIKLLSRGQDFRTVVLSKANANANTFSSKRKDILVATPLRLVHAIESGVIDLSTVQVLVLDEVDRLFDHGFIEQADTVLNACTHTRLQMAMFSATMFQGVETLARTVLKNPVRITVGARNAAAETIRQRLVFVGREDGKLLAMRQLFQQGIKPPILVFVQSKERAQQLFHELVYDGVNVDVMHAERTAAQRAAIVSKFRTGQIWVLICTDLMARGIDFKGVNVVINYDFPQSTVSYIHRIGRTGRAGRSGEAVTFFTEQDVESGCEVPDWMLQLQKPSKGTMLRLRENGVPRPAISKEASSLSRAAKKRSQSRRRRANDAETN